MKSKFKFNAVAMGSPLEPVIANMFMVELETSLVPKLEDRVKKWRRFVDDTFMYIKNGSVEYILLVLNSFHKNIKSPMKKNKTMIFRF